MSAKTLGEKEAEVNKATERQQQKDEIAALKEQLEASVTALGAQEAEATAAAARAAAEEADRSEELVRTIAALRDELAQTRKEANERLAAAKEIPRRVQEMSEKADEGRQRELDRLHERISGLELDVRDAGHREKTLKSEVESLQGQLEKIQARLRAQAAEAEGMSEADFVDSFEAVMREEFDAMRSAYEPASPQPGSSATRSCALTGRKCASFGREQEGLQRTQDQDP